MSHWLAYVLGVLTPFVVWTIYVVIIIMIDLVGRVLNHPIYRTRWYSTRRYRLIDRSDEGNAIAITLPWWRGTALVIRFWPKPLR